MTKETLYFDAKYAIELQAWIIENSGGMSGLNNPGQLDSCLTHIQNDLYYPEFIDKLTHLVFSIVKFHMFSDGNKRSSIALGAYFLKLNGYEIAQEFAQRMENIVVWIAENKIDKDLLRELIETLIYESDYSESLKLKLLLAVEPI